MGFEASSWLELSSSSPSHKEAVGDGEHRQFSLENFERMVELHGLVSLDTVIVRG
jgi:hypothetical protein